MLSIRALLNKLKQAQKELQDIHGEIDSSNKELESINKQKQLANQDLKAYMDQIGVDMHKLKMVEPLALALKEAGDLPPIVVPLTELVSRAV